MARTRDRIFERGVAWARCGTLIVLLLSLAWAAFRSWRWPVVGDAAVMHYVNLLMDRGLRPYADITDNNMPAAYLLESWGMHVVGRGDVGWRLWDAALLLGMAGSMVAVVGRRRWWAAAFATGLFALMNAAAGPMFATEREQSIALLLLLGLGAVLMGVRRSQAWLWGVGGFALGLAGAVKPTFLPFGLVVIGWGLAARTESSLRLPRRYAAAACVGLLGSNLAVLGWLLRKGALGSWWFVERRITPAYVGMAHASTAEMFEHLLAPGTALLAAFGLALWWLGRGEPGRLPRHETGLLLAAATWGVLSYWVQGKGFLHHRYTLEIVVLLLVGVAVDRALRQSGSSGRTRAARGLALTAVALICAGIVPHYLRALDRVPQRDAFLEQLVSDLELVADAPGQSAVAAARLDDRVMCLDVVYGCLAALDRMGVRETAGFTGDLMLWEHESSYPRDFYRAWFARMMQTNPPDVLVVSNEWFGRPNTFDKLQAWPEFAQVLAAKYTEVDERRFPGEYGTAMPIDQAPAYRIYVRRGSRFAHASTLR